MIGHGIDRVDGPVKVTGRAAYAAEHQEVGLPLYGYIVGATIARGRITRIDTAPAEQAPGVRLVLTHQNAPGQGTPDLSLFSPYARAQPTLSGPEVHHVGEPVALVVATTLEEARAAASLLDVSYAAEPGQYDLAAGQDRAYAPKRVKLFETDTSVGDFEAGFAGAEVTIDQRYTTPYEFSQPLEPHACIASWHGDDLTVYVGVQVLQYSRASIASTLEIDPRRVRIVAPYIGGGFGSKLGIHAETILAALAARELRQPVKVVLTRQQIFQMVGHRPATIQRVRLGAGRDGRLVAIAHDVTMNTNPHQEYAEQTATTTRSLYAAPNRRTSHRLTPLDLPPGEDVRGPGEVPGLLAVESAMDELADALGLDPVELRIRNEPEVDPETGAPFGDRRLVDCLREGARRFGWERRPARPASLRDGRWLVGYGMAVGIRKHFQGATTVRVCLGADGLAVVQSDMTDIGTGTYTILSQVAAEGLGLPIERVRVELGRSEFPLSSGSGGSFGAANSSVSLYRACAALREKLLASALGDPRSPLFDLDPAGAVFGDGRVTIGDATDRLEAIVARNRPDGLEADGEIVGMFDDPNYRTYSIHTYGAYFAEVGVDADTAEIRMRRMLGVFAAGRIVNPKTARSQLIGGMIWGISSALHEHGVVDTRSGAFVNHDLAEYLVPVHADIPEIDAVMLDDRDETANVLGMKGVGELGVCGSGAAVANAVFNATGVRVRDLPITLDKLLR